MVYLRCEGQVESWRDAADEGLPESKFVEVVIGGKEFGPRNDGLVASGERSGGEAWLRSGYNVSQGAVSARDAGAWASCETELIC